MPTVPFWLHAEEGNTILTNVNISIARPSEAGYPQSTLLDLFPVLSLHNNKCKYRSLAKKGPVSNIHPPHIITSISCKGLKFTPKSAHPIDLKFNTMQG